MNPGPIFVGPIRPKMVQSQVAGYRFDLLQGGKVVNLMFTDIVQARDKRKHLLCAKNVYPVKSASMLVAIQTAVKQAGQPPERRR